jgi:hypothetical protein
VPAMNTEMAAVSTISTINPMAMPTIFLLIDGRNIKGMAFLGGCEVVAAARHNAPIVAASPIDRQKMLSG